MIIYGMFDFTKGSETFYGSMYVYYFYDFGFVKS